MVINLPKLGPVQFRDDITPQEFQAQLSALSEKYGFELPRPDYGVMESFTRGVSRGATRLGSLATDVIPAMVGSAFGAEDYARRQLAEAEEVNRRLQEENAPGFTSFRQIEGPTDFLKYAAETLGETTPDILGIIGTGGVGGLAGKAIAKKGAQEFAEREAKRRVLPGGLAPEELVAREAAARATGQGVGTYLGSYAVNAPDVFQTIFEETGSLEPGAAALWSSAVAALDAILPKQILDSMNNTAKLSVAEKVLERSGMAPGLLRKVAAVVPVTAAREGLTEVGQEAISLAAVKFVDENYDLFTSENFERLLESGVRGAVAGGGFGTLQAGGERLRERGVERAEREAEEARLAREEALRGTQIPLPGMEPPTFEEEPTIGRTQYAGELTDIERRAKLGEYPLTEPEPVEEARVKPPKEQLSLFDKKGQPTKYAIETVKSAQKLVNEQAKRTPEKTPLGRTIAKAKAELDKLATNIEQASQKEVLETLSAVPRDLLTLAQRTAAPTETAPESVLTADRLKETGLSPRSGIFKRLVGKDIIADNASIRAEIETAAANPNLAKSTITALQELEGRVPLELTAPTEESLAARALPEAEAAAAETGVPRAQRAFDFDTAPARAEPAAPESTEVITPEAVTPEAVVPEAVVPEAAAVTEVPAAPEVVPEPVAVQPAQAAPEPSLAGKDINSLRADDIPGMSVGPGGRVTPKVISENRPLFRETNAGGLDDLLRADDTYDVKNLFVTDNQDLALGQGENKGVMVEFRPAALSGAKVPKPGTTELSGFEYRTDIIAPRAVQSFTVKNAKQLESLSSIARRALKNKFDRTNNADKSVTFTRKGQPAQAAPEPAPAEPDPLAPLRTQATSLAARLDRQFGRGEGATLREIAQDSTIDAESLAAEIELAQQTLEKEAPAVKRKPAVKEEVEEAVRVSRDLEAPIDEEIPTADVAIGPEPDPENGVVERPDELFAGEQEASEIDAAAEIDRFIESNTTESDRQLITNDAQLGNGDYAAGLVQLKKYIGRALANKLPLTIKKAVRDLVNKLKEGMMAFMVAINLTPQIPVDVVQMPVQRVESYAYAQRVDNRGQEVGELAGRVANFALNEGNGRAFVVADKQNAMMYAYSPEGVLLDKTPFLMGIGAGDVRPKLGLSPAKMPKEARVTPAGAFTGKFTVNEMYGSVVVLDETREPGVGNVAIHRLYVGNPNEQRLDRLTSATAQDNRIGQGCLNVPDSFYDSVIAPNFRGQSQIFVLPDLDDAIQYFGVKDKNITITGGTKANTQKTAPELAVRPEEVDGGIEAAKQRVGEELSKLVSAIGAKHNLTPEEQGSLGDFMSALGDLMVAYIKAGAKNFGEAMVRARKRARRDLGKNAQYVPETAYKKAYDEAKKIVVREEKATPKAAEKQRRTLAEAVNNISNTPFERFPKPTPQMMDGALNALSLVNDKLRRAYMGFLSLYQINDLFGSRLPSLKNLIKGLEQRASDAGNRREVIDRNMNKFYKVLNKYSLEERTRFNKIALDTTITQVDPLTVTIDPRTGERTYSLKPQPQVANAQLVRQFYTLPKELQDVYVELRREYDKYGDELLDTITKNVSPSAAQKLRTEFESKRLKVYLPLWRHGEYWLSYTDKNNEPVVMAFNSPRERQQEINRAKADGAVELQEFSRLDQISASQGRGAPPTGFTAKIIAEMKKANVSDDLIDTVYTSYLSLFPADSVRQMFRTRKNVEGFEKDVVQAYANVASRMANQLSRIKYADQIDEAMNAVRGEAGDKTDQVMRDVIENVNAQESFLRDPTPANWASNASVFSYFMFIAGNISSAVVNLTQLPIVVYSLLGGEYGFDNAASAMQKAMSMYFSGGKDTNSQFLPDFTFGATAKGRYKTLYDTAVARSAIRRSTAYELVDMRKQKAEDYTGMWAKTKQILGWTFQNSERMNREVTLIAAFDLAYDKLTKQGVPEAQAVDQAIEKAIDVTNRSHGASLAETGPRLFQNNIGKVIFTFKRFAQAQLYLLGRLFNDALRGADPEVRDIARRQLLGVYGMAFMFAGAQGIPLYGAGTMLAGFLLGDDDEPVDVDELLKQSIGSMAYKGPVSSLLNIDIAGRTGFNGLLWRDDPRRIAEVGPVTYTLEQIAGPSYGALMNMQRGYDLIGRGETYRGFEAMLPSFLKNAMKGIRFGSEGATNLRGVPIIEDVNAYNVLMQLAGFTPTDLSEAYARAGAKKEVERKILQRRNSLLTEYDIARVNKDREGMRQIREEMRAFSKAHPQQGVRITPETLERSYRERRRAEKEMVDGVRLNRGLRKELEEKYGPD